MANNLIPIITRFEIVSSVVLISRDGANCLVLVIAGVAADLLFFTIKDAHTVSSVVAGVESNGLRRTAISGLSFKIRSPLYVIDGTKLLN